MSANNTLPRYIAPMPKQGAGDLLWLSRTVQVLADYSSGYLNSFTTTQRNALTPGGKPAIVFDSTLGKAMLWTGSAWQTIQSV